MTETFNYDELITRPGNALSQPERDFIAKIQIELNLRERAAEQQRRDDAAPYERKRWLDVATRTPRWSYAETLLWIVFRSYERMADELVQAGLPDSVVPYYTLSARKVSAVVDLIEMPSTLIKTHNPSVALKDALSVGGGVKAFGVYNDAGQHIAINTESWRNLEFWPGQEILGSRNLVTYPDWEKGRVIAFRKNMAFHAAMPKDGCWFDVDFDRESVVSFFPADQSDSCTSGGAQTQAEKADTRNEDGGKGISMPNFSKFFTLHRGSEKLRPFSDAYTFAGSRCALPTARESTLFKKAGHGLSQDAYTSGFSADDMAISRSILQALCVDIEPVSCYMTDNSGQVWNVGRRLWSARLPRTLRDAEGLERISFVIPPCETLRSGAIAPQDFSADYRDFAGYALSITDEGYERIKAGIMAELEVFSDVSEIDIERKQRAMAAFQIDLQSRDKWNYAEAVLWVALRNVSAMADWLAIPWAIFHSNESEFDFQSSSLSMDDQWYWRTVKTAVVPFYRMPDDQVASTLKNLWIHAPNEWPTNRMDIDDPASAIVRARSKIVSTGYVWRRFFDRNSVVMAFPDPSRNVLPELDVETIEISRRQKTQGIIPSAGDDFMAPKRSAQKKLSKQKLIQQTLAEMGWGTDKPPGYTDGQAVREMIAELAKKRIAVSFNVKTFQRAVGRAN